MKRLLSVVCGGLVSLALMAGPVRADTGLDGQHISFADMAKNAHAKRMTPMPRKPSILPRSREELLFDLAPSEKLRPELMTPEMRRKWLTRHPPSPGAGDECPSVDRLADYHGADLANRIAELPDSSCTHALFSVNRTLAAAIFSPENVDAVATAFVDHSAVYRAPDRSLLNLTLYLRAGYYLASSGLVGPISPDVLARVRPAIMQVASGGYLFAPNDVAPTTAGEVMTLIINMHDEAAFLDVAKQWVQRFTNRPNAPDAARALEDPNVGYGFTGILKVFYFAHFRPDALPKIKNDPSYAQTLYAFVTANKSSLLNDPRASYQLNQTANEAFRFVMYDALRPAVAPMIRDTLSSSTMGGPDRLLWLSAAMAVKSYDNDNCGAYGTCNFEKRLADVILSSNYHCSDGKTRLRTTSLDPYQAYQACKTMSDEEPYFHAMLHTNRVPVADDQNTTLEVVIFTDHSEYEDYSYVFFDNNTNNGGVYLEGDPSAPGNQARFIAYVASWLKPEFEVWNLKHEYVHYLDGRYDMYGDFDAGTRVPTVWFIEGLAEYISLRNDNAPAIEEASTGRYRLSDTFRNTYDMNDYVNRAYRWGYMAVRFVFERHPELLSTILPLFRSGDYDRYWAAMQQILTQWDAEFAAWAPTATTGGTPRPPRRVN